MRIKTETKNEDKQAKLKLKLKLEHYQNNISLAARYAEKHLQSEV